MEMKGNRNPTAQSDPSTDPESIETLTAGRTANNGCDGTDGEPDPFDPEHLRQAYASRDVVGVKRALIRIAVKKPDRYWFVRTHPDPEYWLRVGTLELKEEREMYLLTPTMYQFLRPYGAAMRALIPAINRQRVLFLWPIRLPDEEGRIDSWSESAYEIAGMAVDGWVSPSANRDAGLYEAIIPEATLDDPTWPDLSLREIIKLAFKGREIDNEDHPVVQRILGKS